MRVPPLILLARNLDILTLASEEIQCKGNKA
jgi:hypothetical protein